MGTFLFLRAVDDNVTALVHQAGMTPVMWNIDSSDWRHALVYEQPGQSNRIISEGLSYTHGKASFFS